MKKLLLATTMLAGTAGFAAAEVTVSGSANMWLADNGTTTSTKHSIDVSFGMSGETDGGLSFGASLTLQEDGSTDGPGSVFVSGAFGKLAFGDVDSADQAVGIGMDDVGFDGLGVDDVAERNRGASGSEILYTYSADVFTVALSTDDPSTSDDFAIGASYKGEGFSVALAYAVDGTEHITNGAVSYSTAGVSAKLYVEESSVDGTGYGLNLGYSVDALAVTAAYARNDAGDTAIGIGAAYDLGGGASIKGGIADTGAAAVWDMGLSFTF